MEPVFARGSQFGEAAIPDFDPERKYSDWQRGNMRDAYVKYIIDAMEKRFPDLDWGTAFSVITDISDDGNTTTNLAEFLAWWDGGIRDEAAAYAPTHKDEVVDLYDDGGEVI